MKKLIAKIVFFSCIFTLLLSVLSSVLPAAGAAADSGFSIVGAFVDDIVRPGNTYAYTTRIESTADATALDIVVDACGFGNDLKGTWIYIDPVNDSSPYSALDYISGPAPASFHLNPGGSQEVTWNVEVPADVGAGGRYAMLHVYTQPVGGGSVGYVLAAEIPIILTVADSQITMTGQITDLSVGNVSSAQPIEVSTILRNTGNYHYKARNEVKMTDAYGNLVATAYTLLSNEAIIPTYSREFKGSLVLLDQGNELQPGIYNIESKAMLLDGTILDTKLISITVEQPYFPPGPDGDGGREDVDSSLVCPGIDESSGEVTAFSNEFPSCIDRCAEVGIKICFSDTSVVTGKVVTGKYPDVPPVPIFFHAPESEGGTGKLAVKFVAAHVDGFDRGNAQITICYTSDEVRDYDEESLILAYWDGTRWLKLSPVNIEPTLNTITGSIPVSVLAQQCTPIGLGGSPPGAEEEGQGYPQWPFWLIPGVAIIAYIIWRKKNGRHNRSREGQETHITGKR